MARPLTTPAAAAHEHALGSRRIMRRGGAYLMCSTCGAYVKPDAARLVEALLKDIVDDGAYNALGTGIVERLLEIKAAL